jgi:hypothetical protein
MGKIDTLWLCYFFVKSVFMPVIFFLWVVFDDYLTARFSFAHSRNVLVVHQWQSFG